MIDSSIDVEPRALTPARRSRDPLIIEQRREIAAHGAFVKQLTQSEIVEELAKAGIVASRATVSRDLDVMRGRFRRVFRQGGFDARSEVGILIAQLRFVIASSFRDATSAADGRERALHRQVAVGSVEKLSALLQETGLVQERDFLLPPDEAKRADRVPSGDELRARFDAITIPDGELISEAEKAYGYGDAAAYEEAVNAARGRSRDDQRR